MIDVLIIFLMLAGGIACLIGGADFLISGGSAIAIRLGISVTVVGLTIVSYGTSLPELVVSTASSIQGKPELALGNVLGSNIGNIGLILGFTALIAGVPVARSILRRDYFVMLLATAAFIVFLRDSKISRIEGAILLISGAAYTLFLIFFGSEKNDEEKPEKQKSTALSMGLILLGIVLLVAGGHLVVKGAVKIADWAGMSEKVIGLTIVAIGTSLPELAASVVAAIKKQSEIAIGNVVGSNIFNILFVIGLTSVIHPISAKSGTFSFIDLAVLSSFTLILFPIMLTGRKVSRLEGLFLLAAYSGYLAWLVIK
ncbi:calcium/sodium antiporter [Myxococcota bacterium]|nr:calcium/sodium antiporter [Myxococcota bacterium]MBU1383126.1 calcium/sodium antiporter [Myxococcota bacterium]MBU1499051.1 calcium/sodium antiporter [Myxococcota bacterium]